jgi:hypothetical protein
LRQPRPGACDRPLDGVLGLGAIAEHRERQPQRRLHERANEQLESGLVQAV